MQSYTLWRIFSTLIGSDLEVLVCHTNSSTKFVLHFTTIPRLKGFNESMSSLGIEFFSSVLEQYQSQGKLPVYGLVQIVVSIIILHGF